MIQRVQTIYLFLVAAIAVFMLFNPIGHFIAGTDMHTLYNSMLAFADGTKSYTPWALCAILLIVALISTCNIFLFKKRMLQIRLCIFSIILLIGYYLTLVAFIFLLKGDMKFALSWTLALPAVSIILTWLAMRGIGKDEMLVRAYDRLR